MVLPHTHTTFGLNSCLNELSLTVQAFAFPFYLTCTSHLHVACALFCFSVQHFCHAFACLWAYLALRMLLCIYFPTCQLCLPAISFTRSLLTYQKNTLSFDCLVNRHMHRTVQEGCRHPALIKPIRTSLFCAPKTKIWGPLANTLLPFSESIQVKISESLSGNTVNLLTQLWFPWKPSLAF